MGPESIRECCCYFSPYHPGIGIQTNTETTKKEESAMKVSCKGTIGELVNLKREEVISGFVYELEIYDDVKKVTYLFHNLKLEEIKFLDGAVSFGG